MDPIPEILTRGVLETVVKEDLEKKLGSGKKLRVKHGIDPTTKDLHLGYSVVYRKLKQFQQLGHTVIFLIGSFTARFGDPTDKGEVRKMRTRDEVLLTAKSYINQVAKVLDIKKLVIRYNGEWYDKMSAEELLRLMSEFTIARMLERDMFQERIKEGKEIGLHEPVYPLLQGYDSVMLESDVTVVGTDQKFNELQARPLQKSRGQMPQDVMTVPLLVGTDGKRKMSQSYGNHIGFNDEPNDMYGKILSIPDDAMIQYFELCTDVPVSEIEEMKRAMKAGENPKDFKMRLGREIVTLYHSKKKADEAEKEFISVHQNKGAPADIPVKKVRGGEWGIMDLLVETGLTSSKGEARRLVKQGGVKIDGEKASNPDMKVFAGKTPLTIQVGKLKFLRVK